MNKTLVSNTFSAVKLIANRKRVFPVWSFPTNLCCPWVFHIRQFSHSNISYEIQFKLILNTIVIDIEFSISKRNEPVHTSTPYDLYTNSLPTTTRRENESQSLAYSSSILIVTLCFTYLVESIEKQIEISKRDFVWKHERVTFFRVQLVLHFFIRPKYVVSEC